MMPAPDGSKSDKQDMNPRKCDLSDCTSGSKGAINKESVQEEEACSPPTSSYDYNCPGCNGISSQLDGQGYTSSASGDSYAESESDVSYGSEALPCYSGDLANETIKSSTHKIALVKSNGFYSVTTPLESKSQQYPVKSNSSKPMMGSHCAPIKTSLQSPAKIDSSKGSQSTGNFSTKKMPESWGSKYMIDSIKGSQSAGKFSTKKMPESWGSKYMNPGKWDINSGVKGETHKDSGQEEEACCSITSNYSDYDRNISQLDDQGYTNTTSGCSSYAGSQNYGSEALPSFPPYDEDLTKDLVKPESQYRPLKTFGKIASVQRSLTAGKFPSFTSQNHVKGSQPADKFPPLITQNPVSGFQSARKYPPLNSQTPVKGFQSARKYPPLNSQTPVKGFQPARKFSPSISQNQGNFVHNGSTIYKPNHNASNGNMYNSINMNGHFNASNDITRGPRIQKTSNPPNGTSKDSLEITIERNKYNLEDFNTDYPDAKFYVIKSFSEDDVYKCIKFEVWASTRYGNKKLNDAFQDITAKSYETGTKCPPTFLFFSVNASGQFVGVAEMIGQVDFNKNMDFWQVDKWNGFFPVKWHIIKDIPNARLRHIILEKNENKDVTFTRDTQEIGLEQGIEMLKIFKNHEGKTSLLDDVAFYENRIKLFRKKEKSVKKSAYPETETYREYGEDYREYGEDCRENGEDDYRDYGEDCREYGEEC